MFKGAYCIVATEHQAEVNIMILVHSSRPEEIHKARRIFESSGAQDIVYTEDASGMEAAPRHRKAS